MKTFKQAGKISFLNSGSNTMLPDLTVLALGLCFFTFANSFTDYTINASVTYTGSIDVVKYLDG